jgi:hypothetical protein
MLFTVLGPLVTFALALYATLSSRLLDRANMFTPRVVDAVFAAVSVVAGVAFIQALDRLLPFQLYNSKMLGSSVVFCTNPTPPSPTAFLTTTASAFVAGVAMHFCAGMHNLSQEAIAVGAHLLFAKLSGSSFSPAVGVTSFVGGPWLDDSWAHPLHYLVASWTLGHAVLFAFAHLAAFPRRAARVTLTRRKFLQMAEAASNIGAANGGRSRDTLRGLFNRYDTTGDGRIDATEFRVALRAFSGVDVPLSDCEATIRAFDADGNGSIDFSEFCHAVNGMGCRNSVTGTGGGGAKRGTRAKRRERTAAKRKEQ